MFPSWQHALYPPADPWPEFPDPSAPPPLPPGPYTAHDVLAPRLALAGSLDPATGIFYRSPEHPRLRTAQACEKCRTRKAKCSGEHPTCKRCATRGLVCEYAKEGRVRGPNKPKPKTGAKQETLDADIAAVPAPPPQHRRHSEGRAVRPRPSNLRLERPRPAPHAELYPSGRRSSCSSGGSLPSSAVSSTFDLSPSQPQPQAFASTEYPPGTHIHQLTHEHQQRLFADFESYPPQPSYPLQMPLQPHCHWPAHFDYSYDARGGGAYAHPEYRS
ncbi:hypothetical protein E4T56_gene13488 [Termitomyces sp. T112]|nr:hypothetical protein E4T56_gene13488 [Termitomyces sp. T112]